jgi:hypothetical protein
MPKKEVKKMDRRNALILLSLVVIAAVVGNIVYAVSATDNEEENSNGLTGWLNGATSLNGLGPCGWGPGLRRGGGPYGFIEVSEEYKDNVISIAKSDSDVQALIDEGYNITAVRPIIASTVEADGTVVTKATNAIVTLQNGTTGRASVWVNVEEGKVTKIVILTMTVIEKP